MARKPNIVFLFSDQQRVMSSTSMAQHRYTCCRHFRKQTGLD